MPQPYRSNGHIHFHPDSLLHAPELGLLIGQIVAESARQEMWLAIIVKRLTYRSLHDLADFKSVELIEKAAALPVGTYLALSGSAARLSVIDELVADALDDINGQVWKDIKKSLKTINRQRNDVVHGMWGYDPALGGCLILQKIKDAARSLGQSGALVYCAKDFQQIVREIQIMNSRLVAFSATVGR